MKRTGFSWALMLVVYQISFGATPTKIETSTNPKCPGPLHYHNETKTFIYDAKFPVLSNPQMECTIRSWIDDYMKGNDDGPELDPHMNQKNAIWIDSEVFRSKNTESVLLEIYEYTQGAAHGSTTVKSFNFDPIGGKEYSLFEILDGTKNWSKRLKPSISRLLNESEGMVAFGAESFTSDKFKYGVVDGEELIMAFDQCEVGPCASGIVRLRVPMADIKDVLTAGFAALYYSK